MKATYVITHAVTGKFWNGRRWVAEFPDALIYSRMNWAHSEAREISATDECHVTRNYGTDTAESVTFRNTMLVAP